MTNESWPKSPERQKQQIFPNVAEKFTNGYPAGYRPWLSGWSFQPDELKEKLPDGTYKMLTLDVSISNEEWARQMDEIKDVKKKIKRN